ncbi:MAG: M15 family metallopeptidase, partial [Candidatus Magasanikbacteria bacterium]|nr:M15 family metallopeptidase [Candidatus Magasanikbacteria bacterium]
RKIEEYNKEKIKALDPEFQPQVQELIILGRALGVILLIKSGYRSSEEQDRAYAEGRTTPGTITTEVPGGSSWHNHGRAVDLIIIDPNTGVRMFGDEEVAVLKDLAEKMKMQNSDVVWGGDWTSLKDYPHFESHKNITIEQAKLGEKPRLNNYKEQIAQALKPSR